MVTINGIDYNVDFTRVSRSYRKSYKYQLTTEDGVEHSEIRAVYLDFSLVIGNLDAVSYDALMAALLASPGDVTVVLPANRNGTETYTGTFSGIGDELMTQNDDENFWDSLTLNFRGTVPMEAAT